MARPVRLEYAGALYQVTAREDRQEPFLGDAVFIDRIHGADSGDTLREVSKARRRSPLTPDLSLRPPDGRLLRLHPRERKTGFSHLFRQAPNAPGFSHRQRHYGTAVEVFLPGH